MSWLFVVGAQAVYLRTGDAGITGVAPHTTDADLALAPARLADEPLIKTLLGEAAFEQRGDPGVWWKRVDIACEPTDVEVDIMVPERYAPAGGRFAVRVAGPAALVVAKVYKLRDRLAEGKVDRIADKDAADVYRLMLSVSVSEFLLGTSIELGLVDDRDTDRRARSESLGCGTGFCGPGCHSSGPEQMIRPLASAGPGLSFIRVQNASDLALLGSTRA